jgi:ribosomal protein S18 acetylase RimI-like enzyme
MDIKIRNVSLDDIEKVIALWGECGLTVPWNDPKKDFQRKFEHSPQWFLIAEAEGNVIASAMYAYDGHRGNVNYLAVLPQFQKRGVGERLMVDIEDKLTKMGCPKINLLIRDTNVDVLNFYESLGYKTDPVVCVGKRLIADD